MDHLVTLPSSGVSADIRASVATLALAGSFALPGNVAPASIERDLLARFANASSIEASDVLAYLEEQKANHHNLGAFVAQFDANPTALHTSLQQQNDAGGVVLIQVERPNELTDAVTGEALHASLPGQAWLLRTGYSDDPPYGYYYNLAASTPQPVRILWQTIAASGIVAAIALDAPTPPIDREALLTTLQGASDAIEAANQQLASANQSLAAAKVAHETILASLGKS